MALAWKAGWVQALTSSNLVSSAAENCALTRAYTSPMASLEASDPLFVRYLCAIFRGAPIRGRLWRPLRRRPNERFHRCSSADFRAAQGHLDPHRRRTRGRLEAPGGKPAPRLWVRPGGRWKTREYDPSFANVRIETRKSTDRPLGRAGRGGRRTGPTEGVPRLGCRRGGCRRTLEAARREA